MGAAKTAVDFPGNLQYVSWGKTSQIAQATLHSLLHMMAQDIAGLTCYEALGLWNTPTPLSLQPHTGTLYFVMYAVTEYLSVTD